MSAGAVIMMVLTLGGYLGVFFYLIFRDVRK